MSTYNVTEDYYKEYQQKYQKELAEILQEASEVTSGLNMSKEKELAQLSEKTRSDTFKIMVTGTFKNGKSTFINALLGEEILPAYALPCTAVINELKYGTEKRAILHFRNPLPDPLPERLAEKAVRHMEKHKGGAIPPLEIPYDEIEDYVVIPMDMADENLAKQAKLQSPYAKVEVFYPLELLQNGVEIIDSPGLNEDETRTRVTQEYLQKVDAILYILNAGAICAQDEMAFVERDLLGNDFESVFFVVNKFDLIRPGQQPGIRRFAEIKLKDLYQEMQEKKQPELFCLSAQQALDGRLDQDAGLLEKSGMMPLERRLAEFLTREKGRAKLATPAKQVRTILSREALETVIPKERALLEVSLNDLKKKYDDIKPRLDYMTKDKNQKKNNMTEKIEGSGRIFERLAVAQMNQIVNAIPAWVKDFEPATSLGAIPTKKKVEQVVSEITDHIKEKISDEQRDWQKNVLAPEIEEAADKIFSAAEKDFGDIFEEIDNINLELAGGEYQPEKIPFWKRVAGVAGGLFLDPGLAVAGGINGIGASFAKTLAFEFGAYCVLAMLGFLNPVTIVMVILAAVGGNLFSGATNAMRTLKENITEQVANNMKEKTPGQAKEIADGIQQKFQEKADEIVESVSKELEDVEEQLNAVIREKEKGEKEVELRKESLKESEKKIHVLNRRLDDLIFALVESSATKA